MLSVTSSILLISLYITSQLVGKTEAQLITQPPSNITAALGTNATFSCRGNGDIIWEIASTQVMTEQLVQLFAREKVYVPLPTPSVSELIMTATEMNNFTRTIRCVIDPILFFTQESAPVRLLVYGEPHLPFNLSIEVDGENLIASWREPFSLEGEELSYFVEIYSLNFLDNITLNTNRYVFTGPVGERNCELFQFNVRSVNSYSRSMNSIVRRINIPTLPLQIRRSDINIEVFLSTLSITITFNPRDPCPSYPIISYIFNITEQDNSNFALIISHNSNQTVSIDGSNGLLPNKAYQLVLEAINMVGSTHSEELLFYTTGLQSSTAVVKLNRSITVTCTFATGASSTGCQVTILIPDSLQKLTSINITRQNGANQVEYSLIIPDLLQSSNLSLVFQTKELLSNGQVGDVTFSEIITVNQVITESDDSFNTTLATTAFPSTPTESDNIFNSMFTTTSIETDSELSTTTMVTILSAPSMPIVYIIIGVVVGFVIALLVFLLLTSFVVTVILLRNKTKSKSVDIPMQDFSRETTNSRAPASATITNGVQETPADAEAMNNPGYNVAFNPAESTIATSDHHLYANVDHSVWNAESSATNYSVDASRGNTGPGPHPSTITDSEMDLYDDHIPVPSPYLVPTMYTTTNTTTNSGAANGQCDAQSSTQDQALQTHHAPDLDHVPVYENDNIYCNPDPSERGVCETGSSEHHAGNGRAPSPYLMPADQELGRDPSPYLVPADIMTKPSSQGDIPGDNTPVVHHNNDN